MFLPRIATLTTAVLQLFLVQSSVSVPVPFQESQLPIEDELEPSMEPSAIDMEPTRFLSENLPSTTLSSGFRMPLLGDSFKINCAGDSVQQYRSDFYQWAEGKTSSYHNSNTHVAGSDDVPASVLHSHRYALDRKPWSYKFPVQNAGTYHCTLYFAEIYPDYNSVGSRVFSVLATGNAETQTKSEIDVYKELRGETVEYLTKQFTLPVTRTIEFQFESIVGEAFVSAIACDRLNNK